MKKFLLLALFTSTIGLAQNDLPDPGFGLNGKATSHYGLASVETSGDAVKLSDGSFIITGTTYISSTQSVIVVAKYTSSDKPDNSFGDNGKILLFDTNPVVGISEGKGVAILPDGKIAVAGEHDGNLVLYRFSATGAADTAFGDQGVSTTALDGKIVSGLEVFADGKIVVLLNNPESAPSISISVLKFTANGTPDASFGTNGKKDIAVGTTATKGYQMVVKQDKIFICGQATSGSASDSYLLKYNEDGTPDTTFQPNGVKIFDKGGNDFASAFGVTSTGKAYVGGTYLHTASNAYLFYIQRIGNNGALDTAFSLMQTPDYNMGANFKWTTCAIDGQDEATFLGKSVSASELPDTYIVKLYGDLTGGASMGTYWWDSDNQARYIERVGSTVELFGHADGRFCKAIFGFGSLEIVSKKLFMPPRPNGDMKARDIDQLPNGKYVVSAFGHVGITPGNANDEDSVCLFGFLPNGDPDLQFGQNGVVQLFEKQNESFMVRQALDANGKILVSAGENSWRVNPDGSRDTIYSDGAYTPFDETYSHDITPYGNLILVFPHHTQAMVVCYEHNSGVHAAFNGTGYKELGIDGHIYAYSILPDWKILVAGVDFGQQDAFVAKLNADGTFDTTFGTNGVVHFSGFQNDMALALNVTATGKILVNLTAYPTSYIVQLNSNGSIDTSYATNGYYASTTGVLSACLAANGDLIFGSGRLSRLNPDGSLDTAFGNNGVLDLSEPGTYLALETIKRQADGKIIGVGYNQNSDIVIIRLLPDSNLGTLDLSTNESLIYPNPVENRTTFQYELSRPTKVSVSLYDLNGKAVANYLSDENQAAGAHELPIEMPAGLASGHYILKISSAEGSNSVKLIKK